jgi:transcriptional regulator with XRE-family HTH domain
MQGNLPVKIGQRIKSLREKAGLNQDEFADLCGLHRARVGKIENGWFDLRVTTLYRIAQGLKIDLANLLKGID